MNQPQSKPDLGPSDRVMAYLVRKTRNAMIAGIPLWLIEQWLDAREPQKIPKEKTRKR